MRNEFHSCLCSSEAGGVSMESSATAAWVFQRGIVIIGLIYIYMLVNAICLLFYDKLRPLQRTFFSSHVAVNKAMPFHSALIA